MNVSFLSPVWSGSQQHFESHSRLRRSYYCWRKLLLLAVKDICAINTFEKLFNILFSEVYCWYFGFTSLLLSATITDMSLNEVLNLFPRWPLVLRSFLHPPLVARDVVTPTIKSSLQFLIVRTVGKSDHPSKLNNATLCEYLNVCVVFFKRETTPL